MQPCLRGDGEHCGYPSCVQRTGRNVDRSQRWNIELAPAKTSSLWRPA